MKGLERKNDLFSLCGLNCGLCSLRLGGHCGGCGIDSHPCKITRCSLAHGGVEYCFQCGEHPCQMYDHIDDFDSFITHQNQKADLARAQRIGMAAYNAEQEEKVRILAFLLAGFNDGRRKTLYGVAVNLLPLEELRHIIHELETNAALPLQTPKERAAHAASLLQAAADRCGVLLKLRKNRR